MRHWSFANVIDRGGSCRYSTVFCIGLLLISSVGYGQGEPATDEHTKEDPVLEEIIVRGSVVKRLDLQTVSNTGSRLGLTAMQIPATVEAIGAETMRARGLTTVEEAVNSLTGVTSGGTPGSPSHFAMRGFTADQILFIRDGSRLGPALMVMRPQNTFNLQLVEVLKGPASVLYGAGGIAGTINAITKKPVLKGPQEFDLLASYGRYQTYQIGIGAGSAISDYLAYRIDFSRTASDGWVERTPSDSNELTASLLIAPTERLELLLSLDLLDDSLANNWGQPLVPVEFAAAPMSGIVISDDGRTIDERMRFINYNVGDNFSRSQQVLSHATLRWQVSEAIEIRDDLYNFVADREWKNAEQYVFDPELERVTRDRFFVTHDQVTTGNKISFIYDHALGERDNKLLLSADFSQLEFDRHRAFPPGDSVDPYNPVPGTFGAFDATKFSHTAIQTLAFSFEDAFALSEDWTFVTGGRYDIIDLDRDEFDFDGAFLDSASFVREFQPFSWRVGATYEMTPGTVFYAQWSTGKDPVGASLFSVGASQNFDLATSRQWEVGYKAELMHGDTEVTMAYFNIVREDILTQISRTAVDNVGSHESRGVELAASVHLTEAWQASFNTAFIDSEYGDFVNPAFDIDARGKRPPNVPEWTTNLWTSISNIGGLPLEVGGGVRYVGGERFGDYSNEVVLGDYLLVNTYAAYNLDAAQLMVRVRNLFDKAYVPWVSPFYPNQVALGEPRFVEVSIQTSF